MPDTFNKAVHDDIVWNFLTFKVFFHNLIIGFDSASTILPVSIGDPGPSVHPGLRFHRLHCRCRGRLLIEDVDDTTEILFLAQRQMERQNPFTNLGPEVIHDLIKVSIFTVHLINENQSRQSGFFCEIPALFRSNLDPARCTDHYEHTVNGAESAFTSATKSANPGVSRKLILTSFHSTGARVALTETPRLISSGSSPLLSVHPPLCTSG